MTAPTSRGRREYPPGPNEIWVTPNYVRGDDGEPCAVGYRVYRGSERIGYVARETSGGSLARLDRHPHQARGPLGHAPRGRRRGAPRPALLRDGEGRIVTRHHESPKWARERELREELSLRTTDVLHAARAIACSEHYPPLAQGCTACQLRAALEARDSAWLAHIDALSAALNVPTRSAAS